MTDTVMTALIMAFPPTVAASGALWVAMRNGAKATVLATKADEIHVLVNSNLTLVKSQLAEALAKIETLERLIAEQTGREA